MRTGKKRKTIKAKTLKMAVKELEDITRSQMSTMVGLDNRISSVQKIVLQAKEDKECTARLIQGLVEEFNRLNGELAKHRKALAYLEANRDEVCVNYRTLVNQVAQLNQKVMEQKTPSKIILRVVCDRPQS